MSHPIDDEQRGSNLFLDTVAAHMYAAVPAFPAATSWDAQSRVVRDHWRRKARQMLDALVPTGAMLYVVAWVYDGNPDNARRNARIAFERLIEAACLPSSTEVSFLSWPPAQPPAQPPADAPAAPVAPDLKKPVLSEGSLDLRLRMSVALLRVWAAAADGITAAALDEVLAVLEAVLAGQSTL